MRNVDSRHDAKAIAVSSPHQSPRPDRFARLLEGVVAVFDKISIEVFDRLPSAVTIAVFVSLLAIAQVSVLVILWALNLFEYRWTTAISVAVTSLVAGTPIVGFAQMQFRRVRSACLAAEQLTKELIVARDEAVRATKEKSRFLASMSHELRTPLNAIIGFSEIIENQTVGHMGLARYIEYAGHIHKSGTHLLSLINDVLDLSKIESGQARIATDTEVDLKSAINECCQTVGVMAANSGVILTANVSPETICVRANDRMIRQILMNLMSNAVKFTPEKGTVIVRMRLDPEKGAVIEVADTGIGMTAAEAKIALQPYGQIDSYHSRKSEGTGLGLPLARAMVELHGGRLEIESVPQRGTTVSFNIPRARLIVPTIQRSSAA